VPNPPLPPRRSSRGRELEEKASEELLVVAAPPESEPTTPLIEEPGIIGLLDLDDGADTNEKVEAEPESEGHHFSAEEQDLQEPQETPPERPSSFESSFLRSRLSDSPDEDGRVLPSWSAAEEEESRSKSIWTDLDNERA